MTQPQNPLCPRFFLILLLAATLPGIAHGAEGRRASANTGNSTPVPAGSFRMQQEKILDQQGFGRVMTAATLLIPAGWKASGGIVWQQNPAGCGKNSTRVEWRAVSPDGVSVIEILPEETWSGNNLQMPAMQQACPNVTMSTVKDYLHWYVSRVRPGARVLDYRDRADLTESLKAYNRSDPGVAGELKSWVQGGEILLAFNVDGREMRESIAMVTIFMLNRMQGVMPGEIREFLTISAMPALAVRAPHGQLSFKFADMIRRSIHTNPEWSAEMTKHNQKMSAIAAKGEADRAAIRAQTAREIADIQRQGYESRQASQDRAHEKFTQMIRGVDTYVDSTSKERVELPNTHHHVWRLNDGTYLLTDDANLQPGRDLGIDGRQMEAAK
jgi:hypothetical protein